MDELTETIILEAFKKAEDDSILKSKNGICNHISNWLEREENILIHPRTFIRVYDKHITNKGEGKTKTHTIDTINALCIFIGSKSFEDYKNKLHSKEVPLYNAKIQLGISVVSPSKEFIEHLKYSIESLIDKINSETNTSISYTGSINDPEKHFTNVHSDFIYNWKLSSATLINPTEIVNSIIERINSSGIKKFKKKNKIILMNKETQSTIIINTLPSTT